MFRKSKKRPPPTTLRTTKNDEDEQEDDDQEDPNPLARKAKRTIVRPKKQTIMKTTMSVGFGGAAMEDDYDEPAAELPSSHYDLATLSQLQSEQRIYTAPAANDDEEMTQEPADTSIDQPDEQDFVPLDVNASSVEVLNAEEADLLESQLERGGSGQSYSKTDMDEDDFQDKSYNNPLDASLENAWEEQVARRAGIMSTMQQGSSYIAARSAASSNAVLQQLLQRVDATMTQLNQQQRELVRTHEQREADYNITSATYTQQQANLQSTGQALEYYQQLRVRFANWVGGLRQLQQAIQPIQEALHSLDAQVACVDRRKEWENDMVAVLFHYGYLDQVVGRQPDSSVYQPWDAAVSVDEFGRDVQSQVTMQREQRQRRRLVIDSQREEPIRGDESDAFLTESEKEHMREMHKALQEALELSLSGLDEFYTSLQNLVDMFGEWKRTYPEEYTQCHATLSLADLMTPLIQAELCALNDPWNESGGYNESKWLAVVFGALESNVLDQAGVERIVEKAVLPSLADLFDKSGYELLSVRQTKSITGFWSHLTRILPSSDSLIIAKLRRQTIDYIIKRLADIAITIVKKDAINVEVTDEILKSALSSATVGQMHRVKKLLLNILSYWAPILEKDSEFVEIVLSFISTKFLFLLSSLQGFQQPRFEGTPDDVFQQVYQALESTGWLQEAGLMLQTMPIRAAATMYKGMEVQVS